MLLCSGLFVGHVPKDRILEFMLYARTGGSQGIAFFSIDVIDRDYSIGKLYKVPYKLLKKQEQDDGNSCSRGINRLGFCR